MTLWDDIKYNFRNAIMYAWNDTVESIEFSASANILGHEAQIDKPKGRKKRIGISIRPKPKKIEVDKKTKIIDVESSVKESKEKPEEKI